ncbi:hypothetical protein LCGC14_2268130 [marine sediment metagenome]|uniref:Uncharacterized protein n=1 Tax=marine sediment metagenome TaxID=412755 RepID=A0A0F9FA23_9ZZZZ
MLIWQPIIGLLFAAATLVEARKVQRSLDLGRYRHALASFVGACVCATIAEEALRNDWIDPAEWSWRAQRGEDTA